jgi:hypothetical protein
MTRGPGPLSWTASCGGAEGALSRGVFCTLLARRFASLTAGYGEDEGALNRGAVACPLRGSSPS